jgi:hypothetical protein
MRVRVLFLTRQCSRATLAGRARRRWSGKLMARIVTLAARILDAHSDAVCRPSLFRSRRTGNLMSRQTRAPEIYTKKLRPWVARNGKARREAIGGGGARAINRFCAGLAEWRAECARHAFRATNPGPHDHYFAYPNEVSPGEVDFDENC